MNKRTGDYQSEILIAKFWLDHKPEIMWDEMCLGLIHLGWNWQRFSSLVKICGAEVLWYMKGGADWLFLKEMIFGFATGEVGEAIKTWINTPGSEKHEV